MRLISIETKNYRTLEHINLKFPKSYCAISGKNNAGKSSVISLLAILFRYKGRYPWAEEMYSFSYKEDKTQWLKQNPPVEVTYVLELSRSDDPALISFIERISGKTANENTSD